MLDKSTEEATQTALREVILRKLEESTNEIKEKAEKQMAKIEEILR
jgi:hypothetical protein